MKKLFLCLVLCTVGMILPGWAQESSASVQNIIWIIGDGMGPEIMGFFMEGVRYGNLKDYPDKVSSMETMMQKGTQGLFFNNTYDTIVTDSAAAATQMATGKFSRPDLIGIDYNGNNAQNLLELAKEKGKSIGIVSDAYVTDATPAGFTAHTLSRGDKRQIARQQIELGVDVIAGGGLRYFDKDLLKFARNEGYKLAYDTKELAKVKKGKLLGLFADKGMPMAVEMRAHPKVPSLAQLMQKALELLSQNPDGFVLMIEAGKIDWAAHANDPGAVLAEMKSLDKVIELALKYADKQGNTLVYLNADHDTGLGAFSYRYISRREALKMAKQGEALYEDVDIAYQPLDRYQLLDKQKRSLYALEKEMKQLPDSMLTQDYWERRLGEALGYPINLATFTNFTDVPGMFRQLNEKRGFVWATQSHSASPIIGVAYGPYAEHFSGVYHNTDIFPRMQKILGWSEK